MKIHSNSLGFASNSIQSFIYSGWFKYLCFIKNTNNTLLCIHSFYYRGAFSLTLCPIEVYLVTLDIDDLAVETSICFEIKPQFQWSNQVIKIVYLGIIFKTFGDEFFIVVYYHSPIRILIIGGVDSIYEKGPEGDLRKKQNTKKYREDNGNGFLFLVFFFRQYSLEKVDYPDNGKYESNRSKYRTHQLSE